MMTEFQVFLFEKIIEFGKFLSELANEKKFLAEKALILLKKGNKPKLKRIKATIMSFKKRIQTIEAFISKFNSVMKNQWQPVPDYHVMPNIIEVEIVNETINDGEIQINFDPNENMKKRKGAKIEFEIVPKEVEDEPLKDIASGFSNFSNKYPCPKIISDIKSKYLFIKVIETTYNNNY